MTTWTQPERCQLCGHTDRRDLRWALVHWRVSEPGMAFDHIGACSDRTACRARCEASGDIWPLVEQASDLMNSRKSA